MTLYISDTSVAASFLRGMQGGRKDYANHNLFSFFVFELKISP